MSRVTANSMETVAAVMHAHSGLQSSTRLFCDGGAIDPLTPNLATVPRGGKRDWMRSMSAALDEYAPDIVEYHQHLGNAAVLARRFPGRINVLYRHTRIKRPRNPIERWRYSRRLKAFDRIIFVSQAACDEFVADYPALADRISPVPNPIDIDLWRADPDQKEKLILFSGRAMEAKGLDLFCRALAMALDRAPDWRGALMLGDWEKHRAWAEPQLKRLERFGDRVEIRTSAPLSDVQAVTRRAAIAVTPSRVAEALGLTALEAHAAGAALISSGRGGLREASGDHALYVDPPETALLTAAITALIDDPERRLALARAGQSRVTDLYSPAIRAAELDDLRRDLFAARPQS